MTTLELESTSWQRPDVAFEFVDKRRAAVPYAADQLAVMARVLGAFAPDAQTIVDLGCGDGTVGRAARTLFPKASVIFVDNSEPMLERARARHDVNAVCVSADLRIPLLEMANWRPDVVVSGYAIHHLSHERKRALYSEVFNALRPGGMFVNVEHVASPDDLLEGLFDDEMIACMARIQCRSIDEMALEHHARPDKADNILAPVDTQLEWLRDIGFVHVDCYFKYFELAVFGGRKPPAGMN